MDVGRVSAVAAVEALAVVAVTVVVVTRAVASVVFGADETVEALPESVFGPATKRREAAKEAERLARRYRIDEKSRRRRRR